MTLETIPFDPAAFIENDEAAAAYLSEALETGDPCFVADALGVIARARGMSEIARSSGLSRESLYRSLSETGNPELGTVLRVLAALKLRLTVEPTA